MDILSNLNAEQRRAVEQGDMHVLVLAGAGSGKTRVLTYRVAYLIQKGTSPEEILAVTFTNKAADEMKERLISLGCSSKDLWVGTFHSICVRILKRYGRHININPSFVIIDEADQRSIVKRIIKDLGWNDTYDHRVISKKISKLKTELITPEMASHNAETTIDHHLARIYELYEEELARNNALDFDDLIMKTVQLLKASDTVRKVYHERFRHILVDEYQDINTSQSELVQVLASSKCSVFVVGDDYQSIYAFRGADVKQILRFPKIYRDIKLIKLEQNYRSTGNIVEAANAVIKNNEDQHIKLLWTEREPGSPIIVHHASYHTEEAEYVMKKIRKYLVEGYKHDDIAILYRTNIQSAIMEKVLSSNAIPYRIIKGLSFYDRMEIKDIIAYLQVLHNPHNSIALERIINVPRRGIGKTTLTKLDDFARQEGISLYSALERAEELDVSTGTINKIKDFLDTIGKLRSLEDLGVDETIISVTNYTSYSTHLEGYKDAEERQGYVRELRSIASSYRDIGDFLDVVMLIKDTDRNKDIDAISLMTTHAAKGLEYPVVFIIGAEEGLFPHVAALKNKDEMEEERRLFYVAVTRGQDHLVITHCSKRMLAGQLRYQSTSRFLREIPLRLTRKE